MSQNFGITVPSAHTPGGRRAVARYVVVIDAAGAMTARLYSAEREPLGEFDAATEELSLMTRGLRPSGDASDAVWDRALQGHAASERHGARIYELDV